MKAYQPDNKLPIVGIVLLTFAAVAGGLLVGGIVFVVSQFVYLIIVFPAAMGGAGAALLDRAIKLGKVRNPLFAGLFGLLMGILMYGSYHYFDYLTTRQQIRVDLAQQLQQQYGQSDPEVVEQLIDRNLAKATGSAGFLGYMIYKDRQGVTIGHLFAGEGFNLGPFLTWIYWLVELVIVAGIPATIAWRAAERPFCQYHDRWYSQRVHLGGVSGGQSNDLMRWLRAGNFVQAGELLEENARVPSVEVYLQSCENCLESDSRLQVDSVAIKRGQIQSRRILQGALSPAQRSDLMQGVQKRAEFRGQTA